MHLLPILSVHTSVMLLVTDTATHLSWWMETRRQSRVIVTFSGEETGEDVTIAMLLREHLKNDFKVFILNSQSSM